MAVYNQTHFRIRSGDTVALNTDSGWAADEDVSSGVEIGRGVPFRIRFRISETDGTGGSQAMHLQVRRNAGAWADISPQMLVDAYVGSALPTFVAAVLVVDSSIYADGDATSELLTGSNFVAGVGDCETVNGGGNAFTTSISSQETEIEFCLQIQSTHDTPADAEVVDGDELEFRIVLGVIGSPTAFGGSYTNVPLVTVTDTDYYIGGTSSETGNRWLAQDGNGNLYCMTELCEASPRPMIRKSTDDGKTWRVQDMSNGPTQTDTEGFDMILENDRIYMCQNTGGDDVYHHVFRVSTHSTNPDTWELIDEAVSGSITSGNPQNSSIARRSDGDLVIFYTKGDPLEWFYYKIKPYSGSWGSEQTLDNEASHEGRVVCAVRGASDKIHIVYGMAESGVDHTVYHRSLDSGDSLSGRDAVRSIGSSTGMAGVVPPVYYDDSGDEVISILVADDGDLGLYLYKVTNDGTPSLVASVINDNDVSIDPVGDAYNTEATLMLDGTDHHVVYADEPATGYYHDMSTNEGVTWGTDVQFYSSSDVIAWSRGSTTTLTLTDNSKAVAVTYDHSDDGGTGQVWFAYRIYLQGAVLDQYSYRWRDDDDDESSATWLQNEGVNITRPKNTNTRLRTLIDASGDPASQQYQLEFREKGSGDPWKKIDV